MSTLMQQPSNKTHEVLEVTRSESSDGERKLYLKTFLLDKHWNKQDTLNPEAIRRNVQRFVGKPYIVTPSRYFKNVGRNVISHPAEFDVEHGPLEYFVNAQNKYKVGTIVSVYPENNTSLAGYSQDDERWLADIEITDPLVRELYEGGKIPRYVSGAVYTLSKNSNNPSEITDFEPLHLAAVDIPMSGTDRAVVRGSCNGNHDQCVNKLSQASVLSDGIRQLNVIESLKALEPYSSFVAKNVTQASIKLTESNVNSTNQSESATQPSQQPNAQPAQQTGTTSQNDGTLVGHTQPTMQATSSQPNQSTLTLATNNTGTGQPFSVKNEEVKPAQGNSPGQIGGQNQAQQQPQVSENPELKAMREQMTALQEQVKGLADYKATKEKEAQDAATQTKRQRIESVIPENYAESPEERQKAIEALMAFDGQHLDYVIENFVTPVTGSPCGQSVSQAGAGKRGGCADKSPSPSNITRRRPASLTDFAKPNTNQKKVSQAGITETAINQEYASAILKMTNVVGNSSRVGTLWR